MIQFHPYGLIVGLGIVAAIQLIELRAKKPDVSKYISSKAFWRAVMIAVVAGVVGARLWHVMTDFYLYADNLTGAFAIQQGGLSIFGAVLGGGLGLWWYARQQRAQILNWLDLAIFGLPFGQAIGRWGNWINQELYGLPTSLPWGIEIDLPFRLSGYESVSRYHPLFLYESLFMLAFGFYIWKKAKWKVGSGHYVFAYVVFYAVVRFLLDFLRIDKAMIEPLEIGLNQGIMLCVLMGASVLYWRNGKNRA